MPNDQPISIEAQVTMMKKYVSFIKRGKMRDFIHYTSKIKHCKCCFT